MHLGRSLALLGLAASATFLVGIAADLYVLRLLVKPIPVLVLAFWVWRRGQRPYSRAITMGLLLSAVGDVLLEVSAAAFVYGVGAFLVAHVAYIFAFVGVAPGLRPFRALVFAAWGLGLVWWLLPGLVSAGMLVPVALYSAVICVMMWRATVRLDDGTRAGVYACVGALLFALSDSLIAFDRFGEVEVPAVRYVIILLYWLGQLGIAASARVGTAHGSTRAS